MKVHDSIIIDAPIDVVWAVYSSVTEWPTWTTSVKSVTLLDDQPQRVGARVRISQPACPPWTGPSPPSTPVHPGLGKPAAPGPGPYRCLP